MDELNKKKDLVLAFVFSLITVVTAVTTYRFCMMPDDFGDHIQYPTNNAVKFIAILAFFLFCEIITHQEEKIHLLNFEVNRNRAKLLLAVLVFLSPFCCCFGICFVCRNRRKTFGW